MARDSNDGDQGRGDVRRALTFKALCVLAEAQAAAKRGRVPPSLGLRFALAYLYAVGDRRGEWFDREPYVEFWQVATRGTATSNGVNSDVGGSARAATLQTCVNAIGRAAGVEVTVNVLIALSKATRWGD